MNIELLFCSIRDRQLTFPPRGRARRSPLRDRRDAYGAGMRAPASTAPRPPTARDNDRTSSVWNHIMPPDPVAVLDSCNPVST